MLEGILVWEQFHFFELNDHPNTSQNFSKFQGVQRVSEPWIKSFIQDRFICKDMSVYLEGSSSTSSREKEEDLFSNISTDKALQFAVVLAEINRKYTTQNFKP